MPRCDVLTFDCYGALVDWERGIAEAVEAAARAAGLTLDRRAVLAADHDIEPAVEAKVFRSYREVLTETAWRLAARLGWPLAPARHPRSVDQPEGRAGPRGGEGVRAFPTLAAFADWLTGTR